MTAGWAVAEAVATSSRPFVGRDWESGLLRGVVAEAADRGAARVVVGEPGIGRTALLGHLADSTPHRVVWVRGSQAEAELPYAAAAALFAGLAGYFVKVPAVRRRALEIALALADGPPPSPLAVCAGALDVLGAAARQEPLVVLVDDLQWVDAESRRLLVYAGRRLEPARVALVMALRDEPGTAVDPPDLPVLRLAGLDLADCRHLARVHGLLAGDGDVAAVAEVTGGNPLALIETLSGVPRVSDHPGELAVEVGASVLPAWQGVLARLPDRARSALLVLAVAGTVAPATFEAVLAELGLSPHDAEQPGLVSHTGGEPRLRHRLLGPVLMAAAPVATRAAVYHALAAHAGPEHEPWYRSLAATGPAEELAERLVGTARRAGGPETAARLLRRAAELTAAPPLRAERLLSAAAAAVRAGQGERAASWCREAIALGAESECEAAAMIRCGEALGLAGRHRQAYDELAGAASRLAPTDPMAAAELLCAATLPATVMGEANLAHAAAAEAELLAEGVPLPARERLRIHAARVIRGCPDGEAGTPAVRELAGDPLSLVQAALVHMWAERPAPARAAIDAAVDRARRSGPPSLLATALAVRGDLGYRTGGWAAAYADAVAAVDVAARAAPNGTIAFGLAVLARLEAAQGSGELAARRLVRSRAEAGRFGVDLRLLLEPAVHGFAALTAGEPGAAIEPLEAAWAHAVESGVRHPNVVPFAGDLAEAHARCGDRERALEIATWLADQATALRLRSPLAAAWRCRGLLATDADEAAAAFAAAHEAATQRAAPFEHARTLLCAGEVLRRSRRPAQARSPLARAGHLFAALGATPWAARAAAELSAAGDRTPIPARPAAIEVLTPQQLRIANLIAAGRNNVEAAEALFLSRKTVEAHLTQVYRKLGVRSRTQLVMALRTDSLEGAPAGPAARGSET